MRALVTGGAGFIGSNLVQELLARGDDVVVLDNFSTGKRSNFEPFEAHARLIEGDLRSYERVATAVAGCDVVFHHAALSSVPRSVQDPITFNEVNVGGTLNVLLAARDAGVRRVMFASSSSVYGDLPGFRRHESQPTSPLAPYAVAKLAAEHYCVGATQLYGLETVSLRYFNVFGPRQDPASEYSAVIPKFITMLQAGRAPTIFGDGEQSRDFVHVSNVVAANLLSAEVPAAAGRVFNVATGHSHSLNDLVAALNASLGTEIAAEYLPPRAGDVRQSWADIDALREVLGYEPAMGWEDGLASTIESYAAASEALA